MHPSPLPDLPFQKVGTDPFEWDKKTYLLIVDYYSWFIEITKLTQTTATEVFSRIRLQPCHKQSPLSEGKRRSGTCCEDSETVAEKER